MHWMSDGIMQLREKGRLQELINKNWRSNQDCTKEAMEANGGVCKELAFELDSYDLSKSHKARNKQKSNFWFTFLP